MEDLSAMEGFHGKDNFIEKTKFVDRADVLLREKVLIDLRVEPFDCEVLTRQLYHAVVGQIDRQWVRFQADD